MNSPRLIWQLPDRQLDLTDQPLVMGIVNVTPDSFSDGGQFSRLDAAVSHAMTLVEQGADILDIGGESSRPGATPVSLEEELRRVVPVVQALRGKSDILISVDTYKGEVARQCLDGGAQIINDIYGLQGDPAMAEAVRDHRAGIVLMHMQGTPQTMQQNPAYENVVDDICRFFQMRLQALADKGIAQEQVTLDPGIGFGKTSAHNLELLARLEEFQALGRPVCLGVSRKGFLGRLLDRPVEQRLAASLSAACFAMAKNSAQILRVHDVAATRDAVKLATALRKATRPLRS